jgi:steroid delta-isomerase-like uncharacterized protein
MGLLLASVSGCFSQTNTTPAEPMEDKLEKNKKIMSNAYEKVFNQNNPDEVENLFSTKYVVHHPVAPFKGLDILKQQVSYANNALAGYHIDVHDIFSENHKVVSRFTVRGKHVDTFFNIPATGKSLIITGMLFTHIKDNKIAEEWEFFDQIGILQQLGALRSVPDSPIPALTRTTSHEFEWGQSSLTKISSSRLKTNKSLIYQMVDEVWNKRIEAAFAIYFSDKFIIHAPNLPDIKNRIDIKHYWTKIGTGTNNFNITINDMIAESNIVAIRLSNQFDNLATGKQIVTGGIAIFKIANSKIVECWLSADMTGLYKQLSILHSQ